MKIYLHEITDIDISRVGLPIAVATHARSCNSQLLQKLQYAGSNKIANIAYVVYSHEIDARVRHSPR